MTSEQEEKRYCCYHIEWDDDMHDYEPADDVMHDGKVLEFDLYSEFLEFMNSLTEDEKQGLGLWRLVDLHTNEHLTISDGKFDELSFLSIEANR